MLLVVIQAGMEPCGEPKAARSPTFPCFLPAVSYRAGWWPGRLPAELAALLFLQASRLGAMAGALSTREL